MGDLVSPVIDGQIVGDGVVDVGCAEGLADGHVVPSGIDGKMEGLAEDVVGLALGPKEDRKLGFALGKNIGSMLGRNDDTTDGETVTGL